MNSENPDVKTIRVTVKKSEWRSLKDETWEKTAERAKPEYKVKRRYDLLPTSKGLRQRMQASKVHEL